MDTGRNEKDEHLSAIKLNKREVDANATSLELNFLNFLSFPNRQVPMIKLYNLSNLIIGTLGMKKILRWVFPC